MYMRSNKQAEAWLQTHPILAPLGLSLALALSSAPLPFLSPTLLITIWIMTLGQVELTENLPRTGGVGLALQGRSLHLTMR
jgi:hypothetical protein